MRIAGQEAWTRGIFPYSERHAVVTFIFNTCSFKIFTLTPVRRARSGWMSMSSPRSSQRLDPTQHMQPPRSTLPAVWFNGMNAAATTNPELSAMFREDQFDRGIGQPDSWPGIDWDEVGPRDDARRRRVREILEDGAAQNSQDFYHCAFMMHHSISWLRFSFPPILT